MVELVEGAYYRDLVESAPDAMLVVDQQGLIELVNRQAERLFGYQRGELIGRPVEVLVPEGAKSVHPAHRAAYAADPRARPMGAGLDLSARRRDGTDVPVDISLSPLHTDRGMKTSVAIRDVTERKRSERALHDAYARLSETVAELERHDRVMTLVNEMGDLLQSCLTREEAHRVVAGYGSRLFTSDSGAVFTEASSANVLEAVAVWGEAIGAGAVVDRDDCWALRRSQPHVVPGPGEGVACGHLDAVPAYGAICVPMMAQGKAFGLLHVLLGPEAGDGGGATAVEPKRRLAATVAEQLSLALANLSLRETLRRQSVSDPLTGIFNRRYMEDRLAREIARARHAGHPVAIVAVDVDHFKDVNDERGHGVGDAVLRTVARALEENVRGTDVVCRVGGDEFVVVLPGSDLAVAVERAEELRQAVADRARADGQSLPPVTLSLGVAVFPDHGRTAEAVLRAADSAMYEAKQAGRDAVAHAAGVVE